MQKKRPLPSLLTGLALLLVAHGVSAIGWARSQQTAVLGQPLDFSAVLRLDPGDTLAPECVSADVLVGDQPLPAAMVRVAVDSTHPDALAMRVLSTTVVDEPVVVVTLFIGCPARMSRRFTLLADPPLPMPVAAVAAAAVALPADTTPPQAALQAPAAAAAPAGAGPRAQTRPAPAPRNPAPKRPRKPAPAAAPAAPVVARLKLDLVEPPPPAALPAAAAASAVAEAIEVVAQAASAAREAASAASAAEQRITTLERTIGEMRRDAQASRELVALLRDRGAAGDSAARWTTPLLVALLALLALTSWLLWRLHAVQRQQQATWRRAAAAEAAPRPPTPTSQLPMVTSEIRLPAAPAAARKTMPAPLPVPAPTAAAAPPRPATPSPAPPRTEPAHEAPSPVERTQVLPAVALPDPGSARDVSIEELLDLEQQAEFFIVLGQDEAAVDLLVDHLRGTGGGSPLPYLKLLEIYRRRDQREAYERTRARFNHRFNAYAPDWDSDLQQGRALADYPGVLPRLQQVWPRPLDAMAELEALLFRKSRGDLFDLPAYREVLFLYSLARDLLDREAADSGSVDLLLPLADGGEFSATSPHPYFGLERDSVFDAVEERPTAPVDLDLSQPDAEAAIVDPLTPRP